MFHRLRRYLLRLLTFARSARAEQELSREVSSHLQMLEDDFVARGMSAEEARFAARRAFGGAVEQVKERQRDERSFRLLDQSWLDVKLALRMLIRYPGLTVVGVVGMSVAMAIAAGSFTIVNTLLSPALPLHEGDRIVSLQNWDLAGRDEESRSLHDFVTWRSEMSSVEDIGAYRQVGRNLIAADRESEVVPVAEISASAFRVARVAPLMGRYLLDDDERVGAPPVVVLGHSVWSTRFLKDPGIIGRPLQLGPTTYTIVGVMPEGFAFPINHAFWVPLVLEPSRYERRSGPGIAVFGRLALGATLDSAQAELTTIGQRASAAFPATHAQLRAQVVPYTYSYTDMDDPENALAIRATQFLVSILLVIVCVNVAILVYARTVTRQAEIAVRSALGAGRRRIVAQLFIEALALSGAAAVLALVVAVVGLAELRAGLLLIQDQLPFWMHFGVSSGTIVYTVVLAVAAAAIVGAVPALKATGRDLQHGLKDVSAGGGSGMRLGRTWTGLVVAQVAFAVALLPTAVYHAWDAAKYGVADYGFPADEILTARFVMDLTVSSDTAAGSTDPAFRSRVADRQVEIVRRVMAEPAVAGVAIALHRVGEEATSWVDVEGVALPSAADDYRVGKGSSVGHGVRLNRIDPAWFDVHDVALVAGRAFAGADATEGATAVVVNGHFVRDVLGGQNAVGRRLRYVGLSGDADLESVELERWYEIVGVVADIPPGVEAGMVGARVYHPVVAGQFYPMTLSMRLRGSDPRAFATRLRAISAAVDPNVQLRDVERAVDFLQRDAGIFRILAIGLVILTLTVVALSAAGIYALMSVTVEQRRKEIGIRAALGADTRRLLAAIFARALVQLAVGAAIGVSVASSLELASNGEFMNGQGRVVLPFVSLVMMSVGLAAAWGPARRGLRIHPIETLRAE
jgi:putative ABC transport system permease protein